MDEGKGRRPPGWWFPARTTAYFLIGASLCLAALSLLGLQQIKSANAQNSAVRIDRAARAAAALVAERIDTSTVLRNEQGSPIRIRLADDGQLATGNKWEAALDTIGSVNQGAANLFELNPDTSSFDRLATTFRAADGTRAGGSKVEPGLITVGHPSFESVINREPYVGEVPVAGRLRLAYLIPIVDSQDDLIGILAVDVGWTDDLNRINNDAARRALGATVLLIGALAVVCLLVMVVSFRPLRHLTEFAHALGSANGSGSIRLTHRRDEIGYLAKGLAKVAELQHSLQHRAYNDALTGVANRAALIEELTRRFEKLEADSEATGFALLIMDLDGFKEINDGLGHQAGDEALVALASSLQTRLKKGEFLARLGGDEFAILSAIGPQEEIDVDEVARRVQDAASGMFEITAGEIPLTASIGIALIPAHGTTSMHVLSHADLALYEVKRTGRGTSTIYNTALSTAFSRRLHLARELRRALGEGTISVHYQPLYDTSGRLSALEALARWTHEDEGPISPAEFVPIAESLGLIEQLGTFVLEESCGQIATWLHDHEDVPIVCVNVSSIQLANTQFPDIVSATLRRQGLTPDRLCLELTESLLVPTENDPHRHVLGRLAKMGICLAIDDFGTGYSSLNYLNELVVDQVKIDRKFVSDAVGDPKQAQLLTGIIALGKNLGLSVVLEGIETRAELDLALASDCDLLQGFLLGRPLPGGAIADRFGATHLVLTAPDKTPVRFG